jgi:hypothetical protein
LADSATYQKYINTINPTLADEIATRFPGTGSNGLDYYAAGDATIRVLIALLVANGGQNLSAEWKNIKGTNIVSEAANRQKRLGASLGGPGQAPTRVSEGICQEIIQRSPWPNEGSDAQLYLAYTLARLISESPNNLGDEKNLRSLILTTAQQLDLIEKDNQSFSNRLGAQIQRDKQLAPGRLERSRWSENGRHLEPEECDFDDEYKQAIEALEDLFEPMLLGAWEGVGDDNGNEITPEYQLTASDIEQTTDPLDLASEGVTVEDFYRLYLKAAKDGDGRYGICAADNMSYAIEYDTDGIATWLDNKGVAKSTRWKTIEIEGLPQDIPTQIIYFPEGHPELALWCRYGH